MALFSLLVLSEIKSVVFYSPFSVVPLHYPSVGKDEFYSLTLRSHGILQECLHKNEEGKRKGQHHGECNPSGLLHSL